MRKELGQLEALWQRPDTSSFAELGATDVMNFSSHAWTVSIDPATGALRLKCGLLQLQFLQSP